jgi:hypothetical protein
LPPSKPLQLFEEGSVTSVALLSWRPRLPHFAILIVALLRETNDDSGHLLLRGALFPASFDDMGKSDLEFLFTQHYLGPGTEAFIRIVFHRLTLVDVPEDLLI